MSTTLANLSIGTTVALARILSSTAPRSAMQEAKTIYYLLPLFP